MHTQAADIAWTAIVDGVERAPLYRYAGGAEIDRANAALPSDVRRELYEVAQHGNGPANVEALTIPQRVPAALAWAGVACEPSDVVSVRCTTSERHPGHQYRITAGRRRGLRW